MSSTDRETILTNMHAAVSTLISGLEDWDIDKMLAPRAEDCMQEVYPKTMEMAPMSNDAFRAFFEGGLKDTFWDVKLNVLTKMFDADARSAMVHLTTQASSAAGPYENSPVLMFWFDERGERMVRVREMVDSWFTKDFFGRLQAGSGGGGEGGDGGAVVGVSA